MIDRYDYAYISSNGPNRLSGHSGEGWKQKHFCPGMLCRAMALSALLSFGVITPTEAGPGHDHSHAPPPTDEIRISLEDWCEEHAVPESICSRCNPSLIPQFEAANDWCAEHDLPESQCLLCNPGLEPKFRRWTEEIARQRKLQGAHRTVLPERTEPVSQTTAAALTNPTNVSTAGVKGITIEPLSRLESPANDPLCQIERQRIRLVDPTIADKAGIRTEPVELRRLSAYIECPAEVVFDQTRLSRVVPRLAGVIAELRVSMGDQVREGDILLVLDSAELGHAKSKYIEARADLQLAKAQYDRAEELRRGAIQLLASCTADSSTEDVRREAATIRAGEAKSRLLAAHAAWKQAQLSRNRQQQLRDSGIGAARAFEDAELAVFSAEAAFASLREQIAFDSERDLLAADRTLRVAEKSLAVAERQLFLLGLDESDFAKIELESGQALSRHAIRSPADGMIVEFNVVRGQAVTADADLLTIADLSHVWLKLDVRERDAIEVRRHQPVLFTLDGIYGAGFDGHVAWVSSQIDHDTRTVPMRAVLPNPDGLLRANMFGTARIVIRDDDAVASVPLEAVQSDGCCQLLFVKQGNTLFEPRKVSLGPRVAGYVEVRRGVALGEEVVTAGSFLMKTEILKRNIGAGCCEVHPGR